MECDSRSYSDIVLWSKAMVGSELFGMVRIHCYGQNALVSSEYIGMVQIYWYGQNKLVWLEYMGMVRIHVHDQNTLAWSEFSHYYDQNKLVWSEFDRRQYIDLYQCMYSICQTVSKNMTLSCTTS